MNDRMENDSLKGTKVRFAFPGNGYPEDQEVAKRHMEENGVYTVDYTIVRSWSTQVFLEEVPNVSFNSVLFAKAQQVRYQN